MTREELKRLVIRYSWRETVIAKAFCDALDIAYLREVKVDTPRPDEPAGHIERMMRNRYGACERHGKL